MKNKLSLFAVLVMTPALLVACSSNSGGGGSTGFKDEKVAKEVNIDPAKKEQIRTSISNYSVVTRMSMNKAEIDSLQPSEYASHLSEKEPVSEAYFSKPDQYLKTKSGSATGSIKKEGDSYVCTGIWETTRQYLSDEVIKLLFENYNSDYIYSFGVIESLKSMDSSDANPTGGSETVGGNVTVSDSEFYSKIVTTEYVSEGNFTIGLSSPIALSYTTTVEGQSYAFNFEISYLEFKFRNHCLEHEIFVESLTSSDLAESNMEVLTMADFAYNLAEEPF